MKDRLDLSHIISNPMGELFPKYKKMSEFHDTKVNPWVKIVHGAVVVGLAINGACQRMGITPPALPSTPDTSGENLPLDYVEGQIVEGSDKTIASCMVQHLDSLTGLGQGSLVGFGIEFEGSNKVEFVYAPEGDRFSEGLAPIQIENGTVSISDALYMQRSSGQCDRLVKVIREEQGVSVTDWYYSFRQINPVTGRDEIVLLQPVLSYPNLTTEEWESELNGPKLDRPFIAFKPIDEPKNTYEGWGSKYVRIDIPDPDSLPTGTTQLLSGKPLSSPVSVYTPMPATNIPDYTSTPEAPAIPEQARADFEKFGYPTEGLTFQETENGVVAVDVTGEVTGEKGKVVYEDGQFEFRFAVLKLDPDNLMPTNYGWKESHLPYYVATDEAGNKYLRPLALRTVAEFRKIFGSDYDKIRRNVSLSDLMLNPDTLSWGLVYFFDKINVTGFLPSTHLLVYETKDDEMVFVPLIPEFDSNNVFDFWIEK